jgi:hypothetical protein
MLANSHVLPDLTGRPESDETRQGGMFVRYDLALHCGVAWRRCTWVESSLIVAWRRQWHSLARV